MYESSPSASINPGQALKLLTDAYTQLDAAKGANVSPSVIGPLRAQTVAGLDRLYGVIPVASTVLHTFKQSQGGAPTDIGAMVEGPDGVPYVLDRATRTVYRYSLKNKAAAAIVKNGQKNKGGTVASPRYLAVGGQDLLILDTKNQLWRWRPADDTGKGTLTRVPLEGAASLGDDVLGINTYLRPGTQGLYNLYVVDPSEQQIRAYSPAADGSGFPAKSTAWLATARDVSTMTSTYVDGDIFATVGGKVLRFASGKDEGWDANDPGDTLLRPAPQYSLVSAGTGRREGDIYALDKPNGRIVAIDKSSGKFAGQYRLADGSNGWSDLRAMYIVPGTDTDPATLYWASSDGINQALLTAVPGAAGSPDASPSASAGASPAASPSGTVSATPKPTKKP